ncbi:hypothetical protein BN946_scf184965.g14 [Trametes cinnabarina]|uniref:Integral membrane protein n=1 Tax=Pycnoporus cinnabarinus TaxID=5643 RepID=A0A060SKG9_PYCCI|nr:hypothetical protein BN946_scf184965.g14 [Trametes cinnabarina]
MNLENLSAAGSYAVIVSDTLEILLFGVYSVIFMFALMILTVYKKPLPIDWLAVLAASALYGTCMAHCGVVTADRFSTLASPWPMPDGPAMSKLLRVGDALFKLACFLAELVMIHRCWSMWNRRWALFCFPALVASAGLACALIGPIRIPVSEFKSPFISPRMLPFDISFAALALLVDMLVTYLICDRLRRISAPALQFRSISDLVLSLAACIVETGALLVVMQVFLLVSLALERPFVTIVESVATQIYGIAPTLMIIQLGIRLLPAGRATSAPQFSTVVIYNPSDTEIDVELPEICPVNSAAPSAAGRSRLKES